MTLVYFLPTQQLNQPGPTIEPAWPCENTVYGAGAFSFEVGLAFETAWKKFLNAVRPAIEFFVARSPTHLPLYVEAIWPP